MRFWLVKENYTSDLADRLASGLNQWTTGTKEFCTCCQELFGLQLDAPKDWDSGSEHIGLVFALLPSTLRNKAELGRCLFWGNAHGQNTFVFRVFGCVFECRRSEGRTCFITKELRISEQKGPASHKGRTREQRALSMMKHQAAMEALERSGSEDESVGLGATFRVSLYGPSLRCCWPIGLW